MDEYVQGTVTMLSLINPVVAATIFAGLETGRARSGQSSDATKAALAILVVLVGAALAGTKLLALFSVSLDAFSVAGGAVLAWMGFGMLKGGSPNEGRHPEVGSVTDPSLAPLLLFAASPGTITGVITLSVAHTRTDFPITAIVSVAIAVVVTWVVLLLSVRRPSHKKGLLQDLAPRLMGLLVLAMGIQFGLHGFKAFMAG